MATIFSFLGRPLATDISNYSLAGVTTLPGAPNFFGLFFQAVQIAKQHPLGNCHLKSPYLGLLLKFLNNTPSDQFFFNFCRMIFLENRDGKNPPNSTTGFDSKAKLRFRVCVSCARISSPLVQ